MSTETVKAPPPPRVRLSLGVTGHRATHPLYAQNAVRIEAAACEVLDIIAAAVAAIPEPFGPGSIAPTRLHSMLADGADQLLGREAMARGWELIAPLPFGTELNCAVNAAPLTPSDARALLADEGTLTLGGSGLHTNPHANQVSEYVSESIEEACARPQRRN